MSRANEVTLDPSVSNNQGISEIPTLEIDHCEDSPTIMSLIVCFYDNNMNSRTR
jgi:hypothetical protein